MIPPRYSAMGWAVLRASVIKLVKRLQSSELEVFVVCRRGRPFALERWICLG